MRDEAIPSLRPHQAVSLYRCRLPLRGVVSIKTASSQSNVADNYDRTRNDRVDSGQLGAKLVIVYVDDVSVFEC